MNFVGHVLAHSAQQDAILVGAMYLKLRRELTFNILHSQQII